MAKFDYVTATEDGPEAFVVEVRVGRRWFYHQGPKGFSHFTREEAARLVPRINRAGSVDLQYWASSHTSEAEISERWAVDAMERR